MPDKKTAVILIHGIGEQRPMDTLWSFMRAAWSDDDDLVDAHNGVVYAKPDLVSESFDLRRLTTRNFKGPDGRRVDFFEYYWAHLMTGNTLGGVGRWFASLFLRMPSNLPPGYLGYWIAVWLTGLVVAAAAILIILSREDVSGWWGLGAALAGPLASFIVSALIIPRVGDAARYLRAEPDNIAARQKIRRGGIALLEKLQATGKYDRTIVVGHSLGSVIAYDILNHAWAQLNRQNMKALHGEGSPAIVALSALETAGANLLDAQGEDATASARTQYRNAQRAYRRTLAEGESPVWLVSDLITLGSPLGKADILLADDEQAFDQKKKRRDYPTSPPVYEYRNARYDRFSYPAEAKAGRIPHHGAVFAPTVWTNHYFPTFALVLGDPISGAVGQHFGRGVKDVGLPLERTRFQHLDYWKGSKPSSEAVRRLRQALNFRDKEE